MRRNFILLGGLAGTRVFDVIVSGGGMVGAAMLTSLLHLGRRMSAGEGAPSLLGRVMLVEAGRRPVYDPADMMQRLRTVSITPVSSKIVDNLGAWSKLTTKHSYYQIAVRHEQVNGPLLGGSERSRSFFMSGVIGGKASSEPLVEFTDLRAPLGFMCYNAELQTAMLARACELSSEGDEAGVRPGVSVFESSLGSIRLPPKDVESGALGRATVTGRGGGSLGEEVRFRLLLGCEGRGSALRGAFHAPSFEQDYGQVAFVCEARLAGVADGNVCGFQNFFRDGKIIAFLPTAKDSANIVFSTTPDEAKRLQGAPQRVLVQELNRRLHDFAPNDIPRVVEVPEGSSNGEQRRVQGAFPLKLSLATVPYAPRALLLGDAAHGIHPFAGQGVNLGIYDVCALTGTLERALRVGQDIGSVTTVGRVFAGEMIAHTRPMVASMEAIKAATSVAPTLSCVGMRLLDRVPLLATLGKDAILHVASGASFAARHHDCFLLQ